MSRSLGDPPRHSLDAAGFAETIAREYVGKGGSPLALFVAFVGVVSARDKAVAADCLTAFDRHLFDDAKP
jgi:hypothetical protein